MVEIMRSIAMFRLTIDPTPIPHRFGISDFRFWIYGPPPADQFNKNR